MSHASPLPKQLRYLQPFRKRFAAHPEELDEITGEAPLFKLLAKRIKGCSQAEAEILLLNDLGVLEQWLADPANENDCVQWVRGFLMVSPPELVASILEAANPQAEPPLEAEMTWPEGAKLRRLETRTEVGFILRWKGTMTAVDAVTAEAAVSFEDFESRNSRMGKLMVLPVCFGEVSGTKFVWAGDFNGPFKDVRYVLKVPGGHVYIATAVISKKADKSKWDESELEAYFHTLRVFRKAKN